MGGFGIRSGWLGGNACTVFGLGSLPSNKLMRGSFLCFSLLRSVQL